MSDETNEIVETENNQYIDAINELKANTVKKSDYDQLKAENAQLLKSILNGEQISVQAPTEEPADVAELARKLYDSPSSIGNLEYMEASLALRDAVLKQTGYDQYSNFYIDKNRSDPESTADGQQFADIVRECIKYADGDNQLFTQELQRRTIDKKYY